MGPLVGIPSVRRTRDHPAGAANHLDFLAALDRHRRTSQLGRVAVGFEMQGLAWDAGLVERGDIAAARWTGELVELGYVRALSRSPGVRDLSPGVPWGDRELQPFSDYEVTPSGREEADRIHRLRRRSATDAALGATFPILSHV